MGGPDSVQPRRAGLNRPKIAKSLAFLRQKSPIDLKAMNLRESVQAWMAANHLIHCSGRTIVHLAIAIFNVVNKNNPD
jgi:hypothetical protein